MFRDYTDACQDPDFTQVWGQTRSATADMDQSSENSVLSPAGGGAGPWCSGALLQRT